MSLGISRVREPSNEVVRGYAPGSAERASPEAELKRQTSEVIEIPCVVNGKRIFTGNTVDVIMPSDKHHVLAKLHLAGPKEMAMAVTPLKPHCRVGRPTLGTTCERLFKGRNPPRRPVARSSQCSHDVGTGKNMPQAEIDAACELMIFGGSM